jgi:hypothetical protein
MTGSRVLARPAVAGAGATIVAEVSTVGIFGECAPASGS